MLRLLRKTADAALDLVYPRGIACALCGGDLETPGGALCEACEAKMPRIERPRCPGCGRALSQTPPPPCGRGKIDSPPKGFCRMCREFGPATDGGGFAPFRYEGTARDLLIAFKFEDRTGYCELFAHYMVKTVEEAIRTDEVREVDCVVPVPMHWRRKFARGYNQSALLASQIARALGIPVVKGVLARPVYTKAAPRAGGGPKERMKSALESFRPGKGSLAGKTVLLVDDILTTGATVRACTSICRRMGAEKVYSVVAAAVPD
jgi:ComF family protein